MATALKSRNLYIDGKWVDGSSDDELEVINPATEEVITKVPQASVDDVDRASWRNAACTTRSSTGSRRPSRG